MEALIRTYPNEWDIFVKDCATKTKDKNFIYTFIFTRKLSITAFAKTYHNNKICLFECLYETAGITENEWLREERNKPKVSIPSSQDQLGEYRKKHKRAEEDVVIEDDKKKKSTEVELPSTYTSANHDLAHLMSRMKTPPVNEITPSSTMSDLFPVTNAMPSNTPWTVDYWPTSRSRHSTSFSDILDPKGKSREREWTSPLPDPRTFVDEDISKRAEESQIATLREYEELAKKKRDVVDRADFASLTDFREAAVAYCAANIPSVAEIWADDNMYKAASSSFAPPSKPEWKLTFVVDKNSKTCPSDLIYLSRDFSDYGLVCIDLKDTELVV